MGCVPQDTSSLLTVASMHGPPCVSEWYVHTYAHGHHVHVLHAVWILAWLPSMATLGSSDLGQ